MPAKWESTSISKFKDDNATVFTKGPYEFNGISYDYKLEDKDGVDFCSLSQMKSWGIEMTEDMSNG